MRLIFIMVCACLAAAVLIMPVLAAETPDYIDNEELQYYEALNEYRVSQGLKPLILSRKLTEIASYCTRDNVQRGELFHISDDKANWERVVKSYGYPYTVQDWVPDILHYGCTGGRCAFESWNNSGLHRPYQIGDYAMVGVSREKSPSGTWYWAATFGKYQDGDYIREPSVTPLQVRFTYGPTNPDSASCVAFSSAVSGGGPPYTYQWNFGDRKTSTEQNPRTFWSAGDYTVTLTVKDSAGKTGTASQKIHVDQALPTGLGSWYSPLQASANFSMGPLTDPVAGFPMEFHPKLRFKISREITEDPCHKNVYTSTRTYLWDFGDESSPSTLENPTHTYAEPGTYMVTMTVKDDYPDRCGNTRCYIWTDETAVVIREITVVEPGEGEVGGTIWSDTNRNGIRDPGEPGIPDVGVMLKSNLPNSGPSPTTRTGADGRYSFTGVTAPGTYSLLFEEPDGQQYTRMDVGSDDTIDSDVMQTIARTNTFILKAGESQTNWDGGTVARPGAGQGDAQRSSFSIMANVTGDSSIGGIVWEDMNENGIQDADEPALQDSNVSIGLWRTDWGKVDETTLSNGTYQFNNLPPGEYRVQFGSPGSYMFTSQDQVTDDTIDSDAQTVGNYTGYTDAITLGENESQLAWDAGVIPAIKIAEHTPLTEEHLTGSSSIGDFVWNDVNANGIQNSGEPGIPGIQVELVRMLSKFEFQRANATTDADGKYLFDGLESGTYFVQFTLPPGANVTQLNAGSDDARDSDIYPLSGTSVWTTPAIVLGDNESQLTWDAGLIGTFSTNNTTGGEAIAEEEWELFNRINAYRAENGLEPLVLSADLTEAAVPWSQQMARENRLYHDPNWVQRVQNTGYPQAALGENLYMGTGDLGTAENAFEAWRNSAQHNANMLDGDYVMVGIGRDGGYWTAIFGGVMHGDTLQGPQNQTATNTTGNSSIDDFVWNDTDGNGIQDEGEEGIADATVELYYANETPVNSTVTDPGGLYQFGTLPAGEYYLVFALPAGYNFTAMDQGGDDALDSDVDPATGRTETITLGENESLTDRDAGANMTAAGGPAEENATIGDFVWNDTDGNGIQDAGETGVPGVILRLLDENGGPVTDAAGAAIEAITGEDGSYALQGVVGTTYIVEVVPPDGLTFVAPDAGDDTLDSDVLLETGRTEPFALTGEDLTRDAGFNATVAVEEETGTVSGFVWNDTDGNGARDSGESGVSGVAVALLGADGAAAGTATTDAAGVYQFTGIAAGTYAVSVSLPEGYTFSPGGQDSTVDPSTGVMPQFELEPGEEQIDWNAGLVPPPVEDTETPEEEEESEPPEEEVNETPDGQVTDISEEEETEVPAVE